MRPPALRPLLCVFAVAALLLAALHETHGAVVGYMSFEADNEADWLQVSSGLCPWPDSMIGSTAQIEVAPLEATVQDGSIVFASDDDEREGGMAENTNTDSSSGALRSRLNLGSWKAGELGLNQLSIAVWVYNAPIIIDNTCGGPCERASLIVGRNVDGAGNPDWWLRIIEVQSGPGPRSLECRIHDQAPPSGATSVTSDAAITPNVWTHVACVYDGVVLRMYVDGVLQSNIRSTSNQVLFERDDIALPGVEVFNAALPGAPMPFGGFIDELRIYDQAISQQDILELMALNSNYNTPPRFRLENDSLTRDVTVADGFPVYTTVVEDDDENTAFEYLWEDRTDCPVLRILEPTGQHLRTAVDRNSDDILILGGASDGELCDTIALNLISEESAPKFDLEASNLPARTNLFRGETLTLRMVANGFPQVRFAWQNLEEVEVTDDEDNIDTRTLFLPIPGATAAELEVKNVNGALDEGIAKRLAIRSNNGTFPPCPGDSDCTVHVFRAAASNVLGPITSDPLEVFLFNRARPSSDSDDTENIVIAVVISAVLGALLLCTIIVALIAMIVVWRRRGRQHTLKLVEPDYKQLAYARMLDMQADVSKDQRNALRRLEKLLVDSEYTLPRIICDNTKATEAEAVTKALTYLYTAHSEAVGLLQFFVSKEVASSNKEGTLFRANSISSKMFNTYARIVGMPYIWHIFALPVAQLDDMAARAEADDEERTGSSSRSIGAGNTTLLGPVVMEVDPSKMDEASDKQVNTLQLWLIAQKLFSALVRSRDDMPSDIRRVLAHVHHEVQQRFSDHAAHKAIGGFLFLRLVCPSLMAPQVYGLLQNPPLSTCQRQLILIAKVMQNLANDTLPGKKEDYMEKLNDFITSNQEPLREFYDYLIAHADEGPSVSVGVPEAVTLNALIQLHKHLALNIDKILPLVQQEDEGLAEELQGIMDAIGEVDYAGEDFV